jgi:RNA ligase
MRQYLTDISQIMPLIASKSEFILIDKGWYQIVDYVYVDKDTFDHALLMECRGIKFDMDGRVIARPFHKFFNLGERINESEVDWAAHHITMLKLDGSMIHTAFSPEGKALAMTRKGVTDIAKVVQDLFFREGDRHTHISNVLMNSGYTPLFEYTAPNNRIVIPYETSMLTLLAARNMHSGEYMDRTSLETMAAQWHVPMIRRHYSNARNLLTMARDAKDVEGIVIQFEDGFMLKVKAEDYVLKHRALDDLGSKKKVLAVVFADGVDDMLPLLGELDRAQLLDFRDQVNRQVTAVVDAVEEAIAKWGGLDRKTYAALIMAYADKRVLATMFAAYDKKDIRCSVKDMFTKNIDLIGPEWRGQ